MDEAVAWIEAVTGEKMEAGQTFDEWLRSGVVLCKLANKLAPNSVRKINKGSMPFMQMENISQFIRVAKHVGLKPSDCFDTVDLYNGRDIGKVVQTIHALGSHVQTHLTGYTGPQLGVKLAQKNVRDFTPAQLAASKAATSKISQGSRDTMDRNEVTRAGITFGHDHAGGSGATNATTKLTAGSAAVMERAAVQKTGITFGHDMAGSGGKTDASLVGTRATAGSAAVMERSEVRKAGITFGHDHAGGSGAADATSKLTTGSADVMERAPVHKPGITFGHDVTTSPQ